MDSASGKTAKTTDAQHARFRLLSSVGEVDGLNRNRGFATRQPRRYADRIEQYDVRELLMSFNQSLARRPVIWLIAALGFISIL